MRSLAIFQVGESGEGRIVREIERSRLAGIDADYRAALKLFVKEEGRHARILAAMVRELGGSLRRTAWTDRLFVQGRRLMGLRLKLLVLLAAEVIGIGFYGLLAERLENCSIGRALRQICGDEEAHLEFHAAFFRGQTTSPWRRALFSVTWFAVAAAACAVVLVDHRPTLRALAIEGAPRRLWGLVRAVHRRVCVGEVVAPAGRASVTV
ncbi:hypothetical protein [Nannocystis pusilla]|uniref:hypothetical protein n=1 Tax=Nannocystis pusilla TaxID=889268 RepID=UPI003B82BDCA